MSSTGFLVLRRRVRFLGASLAEAGADSGAFSATTSGCSAWAGSDARSTAASGSAGASLAAGNAAASAFSATSAFPTFSAASAFALARAARAPLPGRTDFFLGSGSGISTGSAAGSTAASDSAAPPSGSTSGSAAFFLRVLRLRAGFFSAGSAAASTEGSAGFSPAADASAAVSLGSEAASPRLSGTRSVNASPSPLASTAGTRSSTLALATSMSALWYSPNFSVARTRSASVTWSPFTRTSAEARLPAKLRCAAGRAWHSTSVM